MVKTEDRATQAPTAGEKWEYRPGDRFPTPYACYMYPGHPFTTDPRGGIFDTRTTFTVENFDALIARKRGQPQSDGSLLFHVEPVDGVSTEPQLIIKR